MSYFLQNPVNGSCRPCGPGTTRDENGLERRHSGDAAGELRSVSIGAFEPVGECGPGRIVRNNGLEPPPQGGEPEKDSQSFISRPSSGGKEAPCK